MSQSTDHPTAPRSIGIVGARGHTGAELIRLVAGHPQLRLAFVSSRALDGQRVDAQVPEYRGDLRYSAPSHEELPALGADLVVLALPNGKAAELVQAYDQAGVDPVIVDLSADHRFDASWYYGLPELTRKRWQGERRISNPGCYATAMQLGIAPLHGSLAGPPQCFGVSGYSGAGTTPSDANNPDKLRDNLMPYALVDHVHEREVSRQLGFPVEFMPHVAAHFRGITLTMNLWLQQPMTAAAVKQRYADFYAAEPLVHVVDDAPWVSAIAGRHHVDIGGFAVAPGGRRVVVVATIDNLLKGAATQALQNINMALGMDEMTGIPLPPQPEGSAANGEAP